MPRSTKVVKRTKKSKAKKSKTKKKAKAATPRRATTAQRSAPSARHAPSEKQSVLAAAKALQAAIRAGSAAAAEKFLARDFSFIDAAGHEHPRREVLNALKASPRSAGTQIKVRDYGRVALVTGSYRSAQAGERSDLFALDVWVQDASQWKALIHHNNVLAPPDAPSAHVSGAPRPMDAPPPRCVNPLEEVPYTPKSQAERDIIKAFQALELAVTRNDRRNGSTTSPTSSWSHGPGSIRPTRRRAWRSWRTQRAINAETFVAEVVTLKFWVLGDAAIMRADHAMPGNRRPPYRATRLWVKRDRHGRWRSASRPPSSREVCLTTPRGTSPRLRGEVDSRSESGEGGVATCADLTTSRPIAPACCGKTPRISNAASGIGFVLDQSMGSNLSGKSLIGPYIVDFICREKRLIVEVDGGQHADSQRDRVRDKWLIDHGYRVMRFWNNDVMRNTEGVLETIATALDAETPRHPDR